MLLKYTQPFLSILVKKTGVFISIFSSGRRSWRIIFFQGRIVFYSILPFDIMALNGHRLTGSRRILLITPCESSSLLSVLYGSYLDCRISYIMSFLGNTQNSQSSMLKQWRLSLCITSWWMRTQCIPCMQSYKTNSITCRHLAFLALRYVCKL